MIDIGQLNELSRVLIRMIAERSMPKKVELNVDDLTPFARWMQIALRRRGITMKRVSDDTGIDYSYLFKVQRGHMEQYASYQRPGFENTQKIGEVLGDVDGAMTAAGYRTATAVPVAPSGMGDLTDAERAIIEQIRAMATGTPAPTSTPIPDDHRSAGERAQGVPAIGAPAPPAPKRKRDAGWGER